MPINIPVKLKPKTPKHSSKTKGLMLFVIGIIALCSIGYLYYQKKGIPKFPAISAFLQNIHFPSRNEPEVQTLCLQDSLPENIKEELAAWADHTDFEDDLTVETKNFSGDPDKECKIVVSSRNIDNYDLVWRKFYVLVSSLDSTLDKINQDDFRKALGGSPVTVVTIGSTAYEVVVSTTSSAFLESKYGLGVTVDVTDDIESAISESAAAGSDNLIAVVPFEDITSRMKVMSLEESSLLDDSDTTNYWLSDEVWVKESEEVKIFSKVQEILGPVNFDSDKVSTVVLTGTSVMGARGLYTKIVATGDNLYPVREVADILSNADIAHVSNEGSFADSCVQYAGTLVFCGTTESFDAFNFAGIDVVGLTGNHILDYGAENFIKTLDMYESAGMQYFGGGRNLADAHKPAVIEIDGVKFAFLGYNAIPPVTYFATSDTPGSAEMDETYMAADISAAKSEADFVFVDMQWGAEYQHEPLGYQIEMGHAAIDAGADFVTGVHPHWVQPVEFYGGGETSAADENPNTGLIFYSLGNFLFDQMWSLETREGVMVKHYFYGDKYLGFKLIPTMIFEGAQPRPVTGDDAERITDYVVGGF